MVGMMRPEETTAPGLVAGADALTEAALAGLLGEFVTDCRDTDKGHLSEAVIPFAAQTLAAAVADLRAALDEARAQVAAVRALHQPGYEINGVWHDCTVLVSGDDVPASHRCKEPGPGRHECITYPEDPAGDETEHEVLACAECRQVTEDGEPGYLFWPCATVRLLDAPAAAQPEQCATPHPKVKP